MKNYSKIISNLKNTIEKGGAASTIAALKRTLIFVQKKREEEPR